MPPRHLYLTFSLRTLFVLLTIGCVWFAWKCEQARQQREAVKAIEALGGSIRYDWEFRWIQVSPDEDKWIIEGENKHEPYGPASIRQLIGNDFFQVAEAVRFELFLGPGEPELLAAIPHLKRLRSLRIVTVYPSPQEKTLVELRAALPNCEVDITRMVR